MAARRGVRIPIAGAVLDADLTLPLGAKGLVLFAHGSGSGRHSPRNRGVAAFLNERGFATLLMDLLTGDEEQIDERTRELRFDIRLLAHRLVASMDWVQQDASNGAGLGIGLFGASTGAGAALAAAAERPALVRAVVSRGGRPDLAGDALLAVQCPTLLIVGERDEAVIGLNRDAMARMRARCRLVIVPGATHLFEEPGSLEQVAHLAGAWYSQHLYSGRAPDRIDVSTH